MVSTNEKIRNCPICQVPSAATGLIGSLASNHHKQEGRQFQLAYCNCGDLIYISPAPAPSDIRTMYADSPQFGEVYRGDHFAAADDFFIGRLRLLLASMQHPESDALKILEVGAGLSWMCKAAKVVNPAHLTVAQDITSEAVQECQWVDHYYVVDITQPSAVDSHAPYDVISLTHVIEHLLDPVDVLKRLQQLIAPTGRIFITAPHRPLGWKWGSDVAIWRDWSYNHVPAHVQYFSCGSLDKAARRARLNLTHWSVDHEEGQAFEAWLQPLCKSRLPWRSVIGTCGLMALLASFRFNLHKLFGGLRLLKKKVLPEAHRDARAPAETPAVPPDLSDRAREGRSPHPLVEGAQITRVRLLNAEGQEVLKVHSGEDTVICVNVECSQHLSNPVVGLVIRRAVGGHSAVIYDTNTLWRNQKTGEFSPGDVMEARFCQRMSLGPGTYTVTLAIASHDAREFYDWQEDVLGFEVEASSKMQGIVNLHSEIEIANRSQPDGRERGFPGPSKLQVNGQEQAKVLNEDGSRNLPAAPARCGSVLQIFVGGTADTVPSWPPGEPAPAKGNPLLHTRLRPVVTIGGVPARLLFSGMAPGFAAVLQFNVEVPSSVVPGPAVPLEITAGDGVSRNVASIGVK